MARPEPSPDDDAATWQEIGRRLGHDLYRCCLLPLQPGWPLPLREGFQAAHAAGHRRRAATDRWVRKWLQLRLGAWLRRQPFDPALTPAVLRGLDSGRCPVTLAPLSYGTRADTDASVDRLDNRRGYTPDNLAVMSLRANRAKDTLDLQAVLRLARGAVDHRGLTPPEWQRLSVLMLRARAHHRLWPGCRFGRAG